MYTEPKMSKDVLNIWIYFKRWVGWKFYDPEKGEGGLVFYITFTFGFGSATSNMKADQNDRHEYVVLFLQTLIDLDYANEQDQKKQGG